MFFFQALPWPQRPFFFSRPPPVAPCPHLWSNYVGVRVPIAVTVLRGYQGLVLALLKVLCVLFFLFFGGFFLFFFI